MHYSIYKKLYPNDVLVYIEEFNKEIGIVVFDFIDSNEFNLFTTYTNISINLLNPSMVLLNNYRSKTIQENTIYSIKSLTITDWISQNILNTDNDNSYLIGYTVDLPQNVGEIFGSAVYLNDLFDFSLNYYMRGEGEVSNIPISLLNNISIIIRNVGQGNWNEIYEGSNTKYVYDAGASMSYSKPEIDSLNRSRSILYSKSRPGLILSHWDKDHYHSLIGMTDAQLSNFSFFLCRDRVPNLTSRKLFNRLLRTVGLNHTFTISATPRVPKRGPVRLSAISPISNPLIIFNSQHHKNRNISGIVISLKTRKSSIILSGDAHYEQISSYILPLLNYRHKHHLVVPHHGGNAGKFIYNLPIVASPSFSVISVGRNSYGHPLGQYIRALNTTRFNILQTKTLNDITIKL